MLSSKKIFTLSTQFGENIKTNPILRANFLSRTFFIWLIPFFKKGLKKDLVLDDIPNVVPEDTSQHLGDELEKVWTKLGDNPKLIKAFFKIHGRYFLWIIFLLCFSECGLRVITPILLRLFIRSFSEKSPNYYHQYVYAFGICISSLLFTIFDNIIFFKLYHLGLKCRVAVSSLVYKKVLRLSKSSQGNTSVGQITNLLANDISRFDTNVLLFPFLISSPIQLGLFIYILWAEIGVASMGGIIFMTMLLPFQYIIMKYSAAFRLKISERTDNRVKSMNEIIMGARMIKMYAWETPFSDLISRKRKLEIHELRKRTTLRAGYNSLHYSSDKLVIFFSVLHFVLMDNVLDPEKVFFAASIFNTCIINMVYFVPMAFSNCGELSVALNRLENFLRLGEQTKTVNENFGNISKRILNIDVLNDNKLEHYKNIRLSSVDASWTSDKLTLKKLNVELMGNNLIIIIGPVGCGKSSFLNLLLSELPIGDGKCSIDGSLSYASQDPWIFSGSIRENIVFGSDFDEKKYEKIVKVCALVDDFKQLEHGDLTPVGERGAALSGGQKARVSLARCIYQESDIYLLDDPLSAVDPKIARHIFEKCIQNHLKNNLRILVTHQLQFLPHADHIIILRDGEILAQGTYSELLSQKHDFGSLIHGKVRTSDVNLDEKRALENTDGIKSCIKDKNDGSIREEEEIFRGAVSFSTYKKYIKAGQSNFFTFSMIIFFILSQAFKTISDYWLAKWTNIELEHSNLMNETIQNSSSNNDVYAFEYDIAAKNTNLIVYSALLGGIVLFVTLSSFSFFLYSLKIGVNLHNKMFSALIRGPISFFDTNPGGRIMNRFTRDVSSIDELLPSAFFDSINVYLEIIGIIIIVLIANWYTIFPTLILGVFSWFIRTIYIRTVRDVKRIDSITKSPIFSQMANTFHGISVIRSSRAQKTTIDKYDRLTDENSRAWFAFISTSKAFSLWLDLLCVLYLTSIVLSFLFLSATTLSGNIGIALLSALGMNGLLQFGMRQSAETENMMTGVERIVEYTELKPEAPLNLPSDKNLDKNWPSDGGVIKFENVSLTYPPTLRPVLHNLNFEMGRSEKIGIVGRTGAGKSSLISAIFRLQEPDGKISIDGVEIKNIGLHALRKNISIIPQEPTLFSGTVRHNLDPFSKYSDEELWKAIQEVQLENEVVSLDYNVDEGGQNFSVGQRQLICLARAILRKNNILVMDEATANVDPKTDSFIQETIKKKFSHCSIITIAHRLNTVMEYDKVLVLENGSIMEFDHPHVLLQDQNSYLSKMAEQGGEAMKQNLVKIASESFESSTSSHI